MAERLTFGYCAVDAGLVPLELEHGRPSRDVEFFPLGMSVVSEQRLRVLPTVEATDFADARDVVNVQKRGSTPIPKHCPLLVRRLGLASLVLDLTVRADERGRDVEGATVVLGEAEADGDVVLFGGLADEPHLSRVDLEGVVDVLSDALEVDRSFPK